jgi:hypothetical protein
MITIMLFQQLLFFVQGYSGAQNSIVDADDHENGGISADFAEGGKDVQFGEIYDRAPPNCSSP